MLLPSTGCLYYNAYSKLSFHSIICSDMLKFLENSITDQWLSKWDVGKQADLDIGPEGASLGGPPKISAGIPAAPMSLQVCRGIFLLLFWQLCNLAATLFVLFLMLSLQRRRNDNTISWNVTTSLLQVSVGMPLLSPVDTVGHSLWPLKTGESQLQPLPN